MNSFLIKYYLQARENELVPRSIKGMSPISVIIDRAQGKPRSRSKSGSTVMAAGGSSGSAVSGPSASLSGAVVDPCTSATRNTLRPRPSPSSPVHGAASSAAIGAGSVPGINSGPVKTCCFGEGWLG